MVILRAVIGVVALLFATLSAADSAVEQEQAALEHFAADLKEMQVSTKQQVDFTLRNEDFSYLKQSQPLASPLEAPKPPVDTRKVVYQILVSWSLGEAEIKQLLQSYDGDEAVELVFRGVPEDMPFALALAKLQRLSLETKTKTSVLINPVVFEDAGVDQVPAIRKLVDQKAVYLAKGTTSTASADEAFARRKEPVLSLGPLVEIAERDLIEVMKERLAKVDMEKMKARALNTFWDKQTFAELPRATRHRVRALDPTVLVPADMTAADGTVIHKAGDRINPLDMRPFTQRLVIIDPLDPQQVALAKKQVADYGAKQNVVVIVSRVAREQGWDGFAALQNEIDHAAYVLRDDVRSRFAIDFVPSVVTADRHSFYIEEFAP